MAIHGVDNRSLSVRPTTSKEEEEEKEEVCVSMQKTDDFLGNL